MWKRKYRALAYLRIICNATDDIAVERIINVPKRGIGATTVKCTYQVSNFKAESKEVAYEKKRIWLKWQICEWQMTKKVC